MERYLPDPLADAALARLGRNLSAWRKVHGLTQEQLAQRAGVSRPVITRLERGGETVGIGALLRVVGVLGLEDDLLKATDPLETQLGRALADRTTAQRVRRPR